MKLLRGRGRDVGKFPLWDGHSSPHALTRVVLLSIFLSKPRSVDKASERELLVASSNPLGHTFVCQIMLLDGKPPQEQWSLNEGCATSLAKFGLSVLTVGLPSPTSEFRVSVCPAFPLAAPSSEFRVPSCNSEARPPKRKREFECLMYPMIVCF